jgi:hypothetical protein
LDLTDFFRRAPEWKTTLAKSSSIKSWGEIGRRRSGLDKRTFGILPASDLEEVLDVGDFGRHLDLLVFLWIWEVSQRIWVMMGCDPRDVRSAVAAPATMNVRNIR